MDYKNEGLIGEDQKMMRTLRYPLLERGHASTNSRRGDLGLVHRTNCVDVSLCTKA